MRLDQYKDKEVHIVGVTGAEGSSILGFLLKHGFQKIVTHDLLLEGNIEKSFRVWHKGIEADKKTKLFDVFNTDLEQTSFKSGSKYLRGIEKAALIFVPQSWRLYKDSNKVLFDLFPKILFYNLTKLYLEYTKARIIGVTGTVGKGSVANLIYQLLKKAGKKVYFAGNETWMVQAADEIDELKKDDYLVLEISHRQLLDGSPRAPDYLVYTNIYPNHLDEVSWDEYQKAKLSMLLNQSDLQEAILNYDDEILRGWREKAKSKITFYSEKSKNMNTNNIQNNYSRLLSNKTTHYFSNILAGFTLLDVLGIPIEKYIPIIPSLPKLKARLELIFKKHNLEIYDDLKSTTPWASIKAIRELGQETVLICGGDTKRINYDGFFNFLEKQVKYTIFLRSQLSDLIKSKLNPENYEITNNLEEALVVALRRSEAKDKILISPGAAMFYSKFIKGKKSIKKVLTFLLPKEQVG